MEMLNPTQLDSYRISTAISSCL